MKSFRGSLILCFIIKSPIQPSLPTSLQVPVYNSVIVVCECNGSVFVDQVAVSSFLLGAPNKGGRIRLSDGIIGERKDYCSGKNVCMFLCSQSFLLSHPPSSCCQSDLLKPKSNYVSPPLKCLHDTPASLSYSSNARAGLAGASALWPG